jgi:hypothetical protein
MRRGRNIPALLVAALGGVIVSLLAGMLLASYAVAGVAPSYVPHRAARLAEANPLPELTTVQQIAARVSVATPGGQDL